MHVRARARVPARECGVSRLTGILRKIHTHIYDPTQKSNTSFLRMKYYSEF